MLCQPLTAVNEKCKEMVTEGKNIAVTDLGRPRTMAWVPGEYMANDSMAGSAAEAKFQGITPIRSSYLPGNTGSSPCVWPLGCCNA